MNGNPPVEAAKFCMGPGLRSIPGENLSTEQPGAGLAVLVAPRCLSVLCVWDRPLLTPPDLTCAHVQEGTCSWPLGVTAAASEPGIHPQDQTTRSSRTQ